MSYSRRRILKYTLYYTIYRIYNNNNNSYNDAVSTKQYYACAGHQIII